MRLYSFVTLPTIEYNSGTRTLMMHVNATATEPSECSTGGVIITVFKPLKPLIPYGKMQFMTQGSLVSLLCGKPS